jgi:outer membrane receptor protein involved in Fe transport
MSRIQAGRALRWLTGTVVVGVALTTGISSRALAQSAEAALRGRAPPDSQVTAHNTATGLTRRTQADSNGGYAIVGLPPGPYQVEAGPGTETTVTLTVASTTTLDLQPATAATSEISTVTVTGMRRPEVKTSEVGTTVSQYVIETTPQLTRNFLEFADIVPGIQFTVDAQGSAKLRSGGQTDSSVNVYIDGVGQKNYVLEGGVSGQFFTQGNPFPQLAIGEYKVITSNYKAEYDQISSAAITADTRSGTNEFHGEAFGNYTGHNFRAETPAEAAAGTKTDSRDKEFGASFGGPILQDRLHFFVTYEGKRFNSPIAVTSGITPSGVNIAAVLPPNVAAQFGPASLPFSEDLYFGKLDFEPTDQDRIVFSTKVRRETQASSVGTGQAASIGIQVENDETRADLRWDRTSEHWYNELLLTFEDVVNAPTPINLGNSYTYTYQPEQDALVLAVGAGSATAAQNKAQRGPSIQDDLTLSHFQWNGEHTVKGGIKLKRIALAAQDAENINPEFFFDVNPTGTAASPYKTIFTNPIPGLDTVARSNNTQLGLYLQDDWSPNEKLTLNLGVRWDYEITPAYLDQVTPPGVVAAFASQDPNAPAGQTYAQTLAKGGVNINDYISNGHNRSAPTNEIQPRFGFSYDLQADQKHVIFGGAGRAYDRDLFNFLQLEKTKTSLPQDEIFFNVPERPCTPSPTCVPWNPAYLNGLPNLQSLVAATTAGQEVDMLNNHLKAPYSDQFSIGMRNRLGDWNTSLTLARILSHDGFVYTLGNRYPDGAFFHNGNQPFNNGIPGFGTLIIGNNGIETRTTQVLVSVEKPYTAESRWGTTLAYTFTDAINNRDITQHYAFDEATIQQYPFTRNDAVSRHRFVGTGTIRGPWDTTVGAKLTLASPIPFGDLAFYLRPGEYFANGSNGLPVSIAPNNFFGYRQFDLQITKDFALPESLSLYVRLDILNVFNWYNFADYNTDYGSSGTLPPNPVTYNTKGNILGVPRTFKAQVGMRF